MPKVTVSSGATFRLYPGVDDFSFGRSDISIELDTDSDASLDEQLRAGLQVAEKARSAVTAALANQVIATLEEMGGQVPEGEDGESASYTTVDDIVGLVTRGDSTSPAAPPKTAPAAEESAGDEDEELL